MKVELSRPKLSDLLKTAGLKQGELARLLGVNGVTVSRWVADPSRRHDATPAPAYAIAFVRAWIMLDDAKRSNLREELK
jgi:transcriptional regulator with XRE-family HTH domain